MLQIRRGKIDNFVAIFPVTPLNVASELGLHCLRTGIYMQNTVKVKTRNP